MSPGEIVGQSGGVPVDSLGRLTLLILTVGGLAGLAATCGLVAVLLIRISRLERQLETLIAQGKAREEAENPGT